MNITEKLKNGNDYTQIKKKIAYKVRNLPSFFDVIFTKSPGLNISELPLIYPICPCYHFQQVYDFLPTSCDVCCMCCISLGFISGKDSGRIGQHQFG